MAYRLRTGAVVLLACAGVAAACGSDDVEQEPGGFAGSSSGGASGAAGATGGTAGLAGSSGAGGGDDGGAVLCTTEIRYQPEPGKTVSSVAVAGEWNDFDTAAEPLTGPDASGAYSTTVSTAPGFWAYKLVLDGGEWILDPAQGYRKYVGGIENSGLRVADCTRPAVTVKSSTPSRSSAGAGAYTAELEVVRAVDGAAPESTAATMTHHGAETTVATTSVTLDGDRIDVDLDGARGRQIHDRGDGDRRQRGHERPGPTRVLDRGRGVRLARRAHLHDRHRSLRRR